MENSNFLKFERKLAGRVKNLTTRKSEIRGKMNNNLRRGSTLAGNVDWDDLSAMDDILSKEQRLLIKEIKLKFDPNKNDIDLGVLYEVTGFLPGSKKKSPFWKNYLDFGQEIN